MGVALEVGPRGEISKGRFQARVGLHCDAVAVPVRDNVRAVFVPLVAW